MYRTPLLPGQLRQPRQSDLSVTSTLQSVNRWRHNEYSSCSHLWGTPIVKVGPVVWWSDRARCLGSRVCITLADWPATTAFRKRNLNSTSPSSGRSSICFRGARWESPMFSPSLTWTAWSEIDSIAKAEAVVFYASGQCTLRPKIPWKMWG